MAHAKKTKTDARKLYIFDNLPLDLVAERCGVSLSTVKRWRADAKKTGDDWDKMRAVNLTASGSIEDVGRAILSGFITQYQNTLTLLNDDKDLSAQKRVELLATLADAYTKAVAANKKILPETNQLAISLDVLRELGAFIQQHHPQHLAVFIEVLEPFGQVVEAKYG